MTATVADIQTRGYTVVESSDGVYFVSGFGAQTYLAADDQSAIDSLADAANFAEASFQYGTQAAAAARAALEAAGYAVSRPDPTLNVFAVTGGSSSLTGQSPDDLVSLAGTLPNIRVATAADHDQASRALMTLQLADVPVPAADIHPILTGLLGQAAAGIPFFEKYARDPSMTAQQWTDFQQIDQTTKDRLLYDAVRSLAALMRYLTGNLPTS